MPGDLTTKNTKNTKNSGGPIAIQERRLQPAEIKKTYRPSDFHLERRTSKLAAGESLRSDAVRCEAILPFFVIFAFFVV
jgi:hypothetical protein